jgi:hypothetical protein
LNLYLDEALTQLVPNDIVALWVQRSDLAPVPYTLEFIVQNKEGIEPYLQPGKNIWSGFPAYKYEILKANRMNATGYVQDDSPMQAYHVYAVLAAVAKVCFAQEKAVVARNTTIGGMYRACGAEVYIENDIDIDVFTALKGTPATYAIAQALQETSAQLVIRENRISALRITEMIKQEPIQVVGQADTTDAVASEFLERFEVPNFFSTDDDGNFVFGDNTKDRVIRYAPRKDESTLINMTRVLMNRKVIDADFEPRINAGDVISILNVPYLVITAAHYSYAVDGIKQTGSKYWVGDVIK